MVGNWYIPALSAVAAILSIHFSSSIYLLAFISWIFILHYIGRLRILPVVVSLTFLILFYYSLPDIKPPSEIAYKQTTISGQIVSPVHNTENKIEFQFEDLHQNETYLVVYFPVKNNPHNQTNDLKYGAKCILSGTKELPSSSRNPGQFDYQMYLLKQNITYQIILDSPEDIHCSGNHILQELLQIRSALIANVTSKLSNFTSSWLNSLVLGDDKHLDDKTTELFQKWGLSHIIAISGTHIALLIAFLYFVTIKLQLLTKERAQWFVVVILPFYAILAGGEPSVWRASFMVILFILLNKWKIGYSRIDIISIVFIAFIFIDKYIIYHVGFQFSFLVTFSILLSEQWVKTTNNVFFIALQISFVAQMIILPLQIHYFHFFQPLSILINVFIIPYFSLIVIPFMYCMLFFSFFPKTWIEVFDQCFIFIHQLMLTFLQWIDDICSYPWVIGSFPAFATILYFIFLLLFLYFIQYKQLIKAFIHGVCMTIIILLIIIRPYLSPYGTVTMLDIGQGDAIIIEFPFRRGTIMIDAGANISFEEGNVSNRVYKQILKPYFQYRGIQKIDAVFLTHEDTDHVGSVSYMVKDELVKKIYISNYYQISNDERSLWNENHIEVKRLHAGQIIEINGYRMQVVSPTMKFQSSNSNSLVIYTKLGGFYWLFTGDIEKEVEVDIIKNYPNLQVDVLKVAHHGSTTSTTKEFLEHIEPKVGFISVGANNQYNHPAEEVLNMLSESGVEILRTDLQGAIQYRFRAGEGTFSTFLP